MVEKIETQNKIINELNLWKREKELDYENLIKDYENNEKNTKKLHSILLNEKESKICEINEKYNDIQNESKNKDIKIVKMQKENKYLKDELKDNKKIIEEVKEKNNELNRSHQLINNEIKRLYLFSEKKKKKNGN